MKIAAFFLMVCSGVLACARAPATPAEVAERTRQHADDLHRKALELHGKPKRAERAAQLHRESARLRPASDPRAYDCYAAAADVLIAAGKVTRAREYMEESAEFALARGDSLNAARSYTYAALIAARQQLPQKVIALAARLHAVAHSPTVAGSEAEALNAAIAAHVARAESTLTSTARGQAR